MTNYKASVIITTDEFERINRLLSIQSMEKMTEDELRTAGADKNVCEGVLFIGFDDGSYVTFNLCSDANRYYDDVVWTSADGDTDVTLCRQYALDDFEFSVGDNNYVINLVKK